MKKFYVFLNPNNGEPFQFVVGMKRRLLFWKKAIYSYIPTCAQVKDYKQLMDLQVLALEETGKTTRVMDSEIFDSTHEENVFWAVREKTDDKARPMWYTGKWYQEARQKSNGNSSKIPETSSDIRDCQFFVRSGYAVEALSLLNRAGFSGVLEKVYLNVTNVFYTPGVVTICINKRTGRMRYLKSYKDGDRRLRYAERLSDAMLIFPEQSWKLYEYLSQRHKDISFTMAWKPKEDIPAKDLKSHESELVQRVACDFRLSPRHEKEGE